VKPPVLLFAGSAGIAIPALETLARLAGEGLCRIAGLLTSPDAARGRSGKPEPGELARRAEELGLAPILKPERLDAPAREQAAALGADLLVSFAYGRIFGPKFLGLFPLGGVNVHPSLLPKYRGPSPVQAAILEGDAETGVTVQRLALEMDAGDILAQERIPLSGRETAESLSRIAAEQGAALLSSLVRQIAGGEWPEARPQKGEPSWCSLISREEGRIDWNRSAGDIDRQVRAFTPWPSCFTERDGTELFILAGRPLSAPGAEAAPGAGNAPEAVAPGTALGVDREQGILIQTGSGVYAVERLQYRARKALDWRSFLNGAKDFIGSRLGGDQAGGGSHGVQDRN
jgi:methionyl-tRNA formyltransferase